MPVYYQVYCLRGRATTTVDKAQYEDAKKAKEAVAQLQLKVAGIDGQLKQLHVTRVKTLAELEGLKAQAGKMEAKRKYKKMCERARDLLHLFGIGVIIEMLCDIFIDILKCFGLFQKVISHVFHLFLIRTLYLVKDVHGFIDS